MKRDCLLIAVLTLLGLLGCDTVTLDGLVGDRIDRTEAEAVLGRWTNDHTDVVDFQLAKDGTLIAGSISWDETKQCHVSTDHKADMRRLGSVM